MYSLVLPCFNEIETLPWLLTSLEKELKGNTNTEIIFVDNGSRDGTGSFINDELKKPSLGFGRLVKVFPNRGYGNGIRSGLAVSQGKFVGWTHADSQYNPAQVLNAFRCITETPVPTRSFVKGKRRGRNLLDISFTMGMSVVASMALKMSLWDVNAQPKIFPREFLQLLNQAPDDFSLDLFALVKARQNGYSLIEMPIDFQPRLHGVAKGGGALSLKWKLTKRTFQYIRQLQSQIREG